MNKHSDFILSPITTILYDVAAVVQVVDNGMEVYPLGEYIMQSTFLKMTGFQEQKLKCICWEMATHDYDYRRVFIGNNDRLGECSSYEDKTAIYKRLVEQILRNNDVAKIDKAEILRKTNSEIEDIFQHTNFSNWLESSYFEFQHFWLKIKITDFALKDVLFTDDLKKQYKLLYIHRNRCAHNTQSYQSNLFVFENLADDSYRYQNYYMRFALLILIDKIFIDLYRQYSDKIFCR